MFLKTGHFTLLVCIDKERRSSEVNLCVGSGSLFSLKAVQLLDLCRTCLNVFDCPLYHQLFYFLKYGILTVSSCPDFKNTETVPYHTANVTSIGLIFLKLFIPIFFSFLGTSASKERMPQRCCVCLVEKTHQATSEGIRFFS